MGQAYKVIVSDLDGVIRFFPRERDAALEAKFGLAAGSIARTAFEKTLLEKAITGGITDQAWRQEIGRRLGKPEAALEWSAFPGRIEHHTLNFLRNHGPSVRLALLTNATDRLRADLTELGIWETFDSIFNSSAMGVAKPDAKVFSLVLNQLGCLASEVVFIDDALANVRAAQALGWRAHHFQSLDQLRAELAL